MNHSLLSLLILEPIKKQARIRQMEPKKEKEKSALLLVKLAWRTWFDL